MKNKQLWRGVEIIGKKFTRLFVVSKLKKTKTGHWLYQCLCDCGTVRILPKVALTSGNTKSCGCLFKTMDRTGANNHNYGRGKNISGQKNPNYKHGLAGTREYEAYISSVRRERMRNQVAINFDINKVILIYQVCSELNRKGKDVYVVDHVKPLSKGGLQGQDNLQILTWHLNAKKHNKWPLSEEEKIKYAGIVLKDIEKGGYCVLS